MLLMAVNRFSGDAAICYVLPVLSRTSCLLIICEAEATKVVYSQCASPGGSTGSGAESDVDASTLLID